MMLDEIINYVQTLKRQVEVSCSGFEISLHTDIVCNCSTVSVDVHLMGCAVPACSS